MCVARRLRVSNIIKDQQRIEDWTLSCRSGFRAEKIDIAWCCKNVRNQKKSGVEGGSGWTSVETLFYVFLEFMKEVASPHWGSWVQQIRCLGLLGDSFSICLCACPSPYVRISWLYTVSTNAGNAPNLCGALSERILGQFPGPPWHHTASLKHFFACVVNFLCQFSLHHLRPRPFDFHSALLWNSASAGQSFAHRFLSAKREPRRSNVHSMRSVSFAWLNRTNTNASERDSTPASFSAFG